MNNISENLNIIVLMIFKFLVMSTILFFLVKFFVLKDLTMRLNEKLKVKNLNYLNNIDLRFIFCICLIVLFMFIFQAWLCFPGSIEWDTPSYVDGSFVGWHPPLYSVVSCGLRLVFGRHVYYWFFINIFVYWFALGIIITNIYLITKSKIVLFLVFIPIIGNAFANNIVINSSFIVTSFVFLLYSILLFIITSHKFFTNKIIYIFIIIFFITYFITLGLRQAAFFAVFPSGLVFLSFLYIDVFNNLFNYKLFIKYIVFFTIIPLIFVFIYNFSFTIPHENSPTSHIFLLQIAAASVPSNDSNYFEDEWYMPGKNFEDVKKLYYKNQFNADPFSAPWIEDRVFKSEYKNKLIINWIRSIFAHPINYLKFQISVLKEFLFYRTKPKGYDDVSISFLENRWNYEGFGTMGWLKSFPLNEQQLIDGIKRPIYSFIYNLNIEYNVIIEVMLVMYVFFLSIYNILIKKIYNISHFFGLYSSLAYILYFFVSVSFTPVIAYRYIIPVRPIFILLVLFTLFKDSFNNI